jgi:CheY-like chemotaxis protein
MTGRVLVVEDDPASAKLVTLLLQMSSLDVLAIHTAAELPGALEWKPDLVLMDLRLGNDASAGERITRFLRQEHPAISVVILSASQLSEKQVAEMGAVAAIWKPIDPDTFGQTVRTYLMDRLMAA